MEQPGDDDAPTVGAIVVVLGPQRDTTGARRAVAEHVPGGPIATITAGWLEHEDHTDEVARVLDQRMRPLRLYGRFAAIGEAAPPIAEQQERLQRAVAETHESYLIRLRHVLAAAEELVRHEAHREFGGGAVAQVITDLAELDRRHHHALDELRGEAAVAAGEHELVAGHRAALAAELGDCAGVVITGGHVGVLLHLLAVFALAAPLRASIMNRRRPMITWSAGAMATAERVMLFGEGVTPDAPRLQAYGSGLGLHTGTVCFPHARDRMELGDPDELGRVARRLAPRRALLLDPGDQVITGPDGPRRGARWLTATGVIDTTRTGGGQGLP